MIIFFTVLLTIILCLNFSVEISPNDIPEKGHTFITVPPTTANSSIYMVNTTNGVVVEGKDSESGRVQDLHKQLNGFLARLFLFFLRISNHFIFSDNQ